MSTATRSAERARLDAPGDAATGTAPLRIVTAASLFDGHDAAINVMRRLIQAQKRVLSRAGIEPVMWPRNAGSWPGYVFTGDPLRLAAGHWGLGHGNGAHAPDEFYVIESSNPKVQGYDGAAMSFVEYLEELARA